MRRVDRVEVSFLQPGRSYRNIVNAPNTRILEEQFISTTLGFHIVLRYEVLKGYHKQKKRRYAVLYVEGEAHEVEEYCSEYSDSDRFKVLKHEFGVRTKKEEDYHYDEQYAFLKVEDLYDDEIYSSIELNNSTEGYDDHKPLRTEETTSKIRIVDNECSIII